MDEPFIFKIRDVEFKVLGFTQKIQEAYSKYMQFQLLNLTKSNKDALGADYLPLLQKHMLDVKLGHMDFLQDIMYEFLQKEEHVAVLMQMCLSNEHQKITVPEVLRWIKECGEESVELWNLLVASKKN